MISKFFIERPVLANVIAILMILIGSVAVYDLPIANVTARLYVPSSALVDCM